MKPKPEQYYEELFGIGGEFDQRAFAELAGRALTEMLLKMFHYGTLTGKWEEYGPILTLVLSKYPGIAGPEEDEDEPVRKPGNTNEFALSLRVRPLAGEGER